jgi:hypothetical protein
MNEFDSMRQFWTTGYIFLFVNLIIAIGLFSVIVSRRLVKSGICSSRRQALKSCILTYFLSSIFLLMISYFISEILWSGHGFDILLLPLYYQSGTRILYIPLSIFLYCLILWRFNLNNEQFRIKKIIGALIIVEVFPIPVELFFCIFYI